MVDGFVVPLHIVARAVGQAASADAVLSGQRRQLQMARTFCPPLRLRLMPSAILMRLGRRRGVEPCQFRDVFFGKPRDCGDALGRIFGQPFAQQRPADRVLPSQASSCNPSATRT